MREQAPAGPELTLERLETLEEARPEWDRLAEAAGHPFGTWEWVSTWWRVFGGELELLTMSCRDQAGSVVGILPLYLQRRGGLPVVRFLGYGDLHTPLCAPADRPAMVRALRDLIRGLRARGRILYAERLPADEGWERLGGRLIAEHPDPVVRIRGQSWEEYLASRSRNRRSTIRRQRRRLEGDQRAEFRRCTDQRRLAQDMATLFRLHEARWQDSTTGVFAGARGEFHRALAPQMLGRGWLRLWIATIDGAPAAAYYGFRFAGDEWFYQSGRDPAFERMSVGAVLMSRMIEDACEDGIRDFRFLAGDEDYKLSLATDVRCTQTRLLAGGVGGHAVSLAVGLTQRLPARIRERVTGGRL